MTYVTRASIERTLLKSYTKICILFIKRQTNFWHFDNPRYVYIKNLPPSRFTFAQFVYSSLTFNKKNIRHFYLNLEFNNMCKRYLKFIFVSFDETFKMRHFIKFTFGNLEYFIDTNLDILFVKNNICIISPTDVEI